MGQSLISEAQGPLYLYLPNVEVMVCATTWWWRASNDALDTQQGICEQWIPKYAAQQRMWP
jgi:hypothetical protein